MRKVDDSQQMSEATPKHEFLKSRKSVGAAAELNLEEGISAKLTRSRIDKDLLKESGSLPQQTGSEKRPRRIPDMNPQTKPVAKGGSSRPQR